jgi:HPt (histidine-containing phosphotransfer) domain-containing protein
MRRLGNQTLDLTPLLSVFGEDRAGICELLKMFLSSSFHDVEQIRRAVERHGGPVVREFSHKLYGSAANIGAERLAVLAGEMEKEVKTFCRWPELERISEALREELPLLREEAQEFMKAEP